MSKSTVAKEPLQNEDDLSQGSFPECLFPDDKPFNEREVEVSAYADSESTEDHHKKFREDEKKRFKDDLSEVCIELHDKEEELREIVKEHKDGMKPLVKQRNELLNNLKTGAVWTTEKLYRIADEKTKLIGVYDRFGFLQRIEKIKRGRGLQTTIKSLIPPDPSPVVVAEELPEVDEF